MLRAILDGEQTTTTLSDHLGKAKSTVMNHLETLRSAGLIKRDDVEGRKRVVYHPTKKAKALSKPRTKHVKLSFLTSLLTGVISAALFYESYPQQSSQYATETAGITAQAQTADAVTRTATSSPNIVFLITATVLLITAFAALWYGFIIRRIQSKEQSQRTNS
jgi:DNA-binding transcriptional ArsR family regulator